MAYYPMNGYPMGAYYTDKPPEDAATRKHNTQETNAAMFEGHQVAYLGHPLSQQCQQIPLAHQMSDLHCLPYQQIPPYKVPDQIPYKCSGEDQGAYGCNTQPMISYYTPSSIPAPSEQKHQVQKEVNTADTTASHVSTVGTGKKKQGNLPKESTAMLKRWLQQHTANPYPTEDEKNELSIMTKLTVQQVSNWFINARRRYLPTIQKEKGESIENCALMRRSKKRCRNATADERQQVEQSPKLNEMSSIHEENSYTVAEMSQSSTFQSMQEEYFSVSHEYDNIGETEWNQPKLDSDLNLSVKEEMDTLGPTIEEQVDEHIAGDEIYQIGPEPVVLDTECNYVAVSNSEVFNTSAYTHILVRETPPSTPPTTFQTVVRFAPMDGGLSVQSAPPEMDYSFDHDYQIPYSANPTISSGSSHQNIYQSTPHTSSMSDYDIEHEALHSIASSSCQDRGTGFKIIANVALEKNMVNVHQEPSQVQGDDELAALADTNTTRVLLSL